MTFFLFSIRVQEYYYCKRRLLSVYKSHGCFSPLLEDPEWMDGWAWAGCRALT